jgi:hypothetical protein
MISHEGRSSSDHLRKATATFLQLREEAIAEEQREYEHTKYVASLQQAEREAQAEAEREHLMRTGLDPQELDSFEATEDRLLDAFLEKVRPPLLEGRVTPGAGLDGRIAGARRRHDLGESPTLLGADLRVIDSADGEPRTVWLERPDQIKDIKVSWRGHGWGCGLQLPPPPPPYALWWYFWVPPEDGIYQFVVTAYHNGFLILRANDGFFTCKYVDVKARSTVKLYQYYWSGERGAQLFETQGGSSIQQAYRIDGHVHYHINGNLQAEDSVYISIATHIEAWARGSGSYAELNFADGLGNNLSAPVVAIDKLQD